MYLFNVFFSRRCTGISISDRLYLNVRVLLFNKFNTPNYMLIGGLTCVLANACRKKTSQVRSMGESIKTQLFHSKFFQPCQGTPILPMSIHQSVHWAAVKIIINNNAIINKCRTFFFAHFRCFLIFIARKYRTKFITYMKQRCR